MQPISYCGNPPVPGSVTWNLDPVLIGSLAAVAVAYVAITLHGTISSRRRLAFLSGWALLSLALVSPLCNLSVALFSVRVGQHMLIEFIAAPLLALGLPGSLAARIRGTGYRPLATALLASILFAAALWFWHLPAPYEWTFRSVEAYWLTHITLAGTAVILWRVLLDKRNPAGSLVASGITTAQMTILGALYTFAGRNFFTVHLGTTSVWGLSPLEDQHLGGLIMWIPPGLLLTTIAYHAVFHLLANSNVDVAKHRG